MTVAKDLKLSPSYNFNKPNNTLLPKVVIPQPAPPRVGAIIVPNPSNNTINGGGYINRNNGSSITGLGTIHTPSGQGGGHIIYTHPGAF